MCEISRFVSYHLQDFLLSLGGSSGPEGLPSYLPDPRPALIRFLIKAENFEVYWFYFTAKIINIKFVSDDQNYQPEYMKNKKK